MPKRRRIKELSAWPGTKTIKVEQMGSPLRRHFDQRATLIGLGLNKIGRIARSAGYAGDARHDPQGAASGARGRRREVRK